MPPPVLSDGLEELTTSDPSPTTEPSVTPEAEPEVTKDPEPAPTQSEAPAEAPAPSETSAPRDPTGTAEDQVDRSQDPARPAPPDGSTTEPTDDASPATPSSGDIADVTGRTSSKALTPMAGGWRTDSGVVLEDVVIDDDVTFAGDDVTLRNVRINGEVIFRGDGAVLADSEVGALSLSGTTDFHGRGIEIFGATGRDGVHITSDSGRASDVVLEDVWVHSPKVTPTSHYDGIQVRGVDNLVMRRLHIDLGPREPQHNAALYLQDAQGGNQDVLVEDSTFLGGGYVMYIFAEDVKVRRSTMGQGNWGHLYPRSPLSSFSEFDDNVTVGGDALELGSEPGGAAFVAREAR
ncbi:hypothetical protein [Actinotalea sp. C106]|uniref:hypothetical protein n=1 Tax=Actinotalea sp. C106 TaxID=2908644 RepID=UPI0020291FC3|nr:hypothetical protein [Actinotalea sp. C106]